MNYEFQHSTVSWFDKCFGSDWSNDTDERNHRFIEEAIELVQSLDCTKSEVHQLVNYVYGRPVGEPFQEVGGVMITLAGLCNANGLNMHAAGHTELNRIWTKVEQISAKQAAKPKHSPLPETPAQAPTKIITLCGSSRFTDVMAVCAWLLEKNENAIAMGLHLLPTWYPDCPPDHLAEHEGVADQMDALHMRKIDMSDEIFVVNLGDYIGESTAREIAHAEAIGRPVRYFMSDEIGLLVLEMMKGVA